MPQLTNDQIKARITEGRVSAISIDTAIFDGKQKTFQNAALRSLDQFHRRDISVVFVDIIAEEMKAHLCDEAAETQRGLRKALRAHTKRWRRESSEDEQAGLLLAANAADFAKSEFDDFLKLVHGTIISAGDTPEAVQRVFGRYFSAEPPFGSADKRKSEFPDAFALLSLEVFAERTGKALICVSPDKGWIEYAAQSDHLICVSKIEEALALFNAADQHVANAIVEAWRHSEGGDFMEEIFRAFDYRLNDLDFEIEGQSDVFFEAEPLSAVLQYVSPQSIGQPTVIAVDGETVTFTVGVEAIVAFEALFSFYVPDSVDRDYVSLGSEEAHVDETLSFDLIITADRSLNDGIVFHDVEVTKRRFEVNFGYVEAFTNEDPTHEKY